MKKLNQLSVRNKTRINTLLRAGKTNEEISREVDCTVRAVRMIRHSLLRPHSKKLRGVNKNHCPKCGGFLKIGEVCKKVNKKGEVCNYNPGKFPEIKSQKDIKKLFLEPVEIKKDIKNLSNISKPKKHCGKCAGNVLEEIIPGKKLHEHLEGISEAMDKLNEPDIQRAVKDITGMSRILEENIELKKKLGVLNDESLTRVNFLSNQLRNRSSAVSELKLKLKRKNNLIIALVQELLSCDKVIANKKIRVDELEGDLTAMRETAKSIHLNLVKEKIQNSKSNLSEIKNNTKDGYLNKLELVELDGFKVGDVVNIKEGCNDLYLNEDLLVVELIDVPLDSGKNNIVIKLSFGLELCTNTKYLKLKDKPNNNKIKVMLGFFRNTHGIGVFDVNSNTIKIFKDVDTVDVDRVFNFLDSNLKLNRVHNRPCMFYLELETGVIKNVSDVVKYIEFLIKTKPNIKKKAGDLDSFEYNKNLIKISYSFKDKFIIGECDYLNKHFIAVAACNPEDSYDTDKGKTYVRERLRLRIELTELMKEAKVGSDNVKVRLKKEFRFVPFTELTLRNTIRGDDGKLYDIFYS